MKLKSVCLASLLIFVGSVQSYAGDVENKIKDAFDSSFMELLVNNDKTDNLDLPPLVCEKNICSQKNKRHTIFSLPQSAIDKLDLKVSGSALAKNKKAVKLGRECGVDISTDAAVAKLYRKIITADLVTAGEKPSPDCFDWATNDYIDSTLHIANFLEEGFLEAVKTKPDLAKKILNLTKEMSLDKTNMGVYQNNIDVMCKKVYDEFELSHKK